MFRDTRTVRRVLLVDDFPAMLRSWARECRRAQKQPLVAGSRDEALQHARESRPEVAIVDLFLAAENGISLVTGLREIDGSMFIAVVSSHMTVAYAMEAMDRGANRCYLKPVHCLEIVSRIEDGTVGATNFETRMTAEQAEWEHISRALIDCRHNISQAARQFDMELSTLRRRLDERGLLPLPPFPLLSAHRT